MLLFVDGFSHYATGDLSMKWDASSGTPTIDATAGRRSVGACILNAAGEYIQKSVNNLATLMVGAAVKVGTLSSATDFLYFLDGASTQVKIRIRTDGKIEVFRDTTSLGVSAAAHISANTYAYIGVKVTISDAAGAVKVVVNNTTALDLTSQDTKNTANAYATAYRFNSDGETVTICDHYLQDTTGSAPNNDLLGDVRVDTQAMGADGTYENFTPSSGTDSKAMIDDATPNGDTDYVSSNSVGARDTFAVNPLSDIGGSTIYGVAMNLNAKKDSTGTRQMRAMTRIASTNYFGSSRSLSASYANYQEVWQTNPNSAAAWAEAEVNGAEFGVEVAG